jgi:ubiquinone/menaquinone biosynthesis C-methylase UbiE
MRLQYHAETLPNVQTIASIKSAPAIRHRSMSYSVFRTIFLLAAASAAMAGCKPAVQDGDRPETSREFPRAFRPVSDVASTQFSTEAARDEANEANSVMDWAEIKPGFTVADIGAGEGYYTIRLAKRVGEKGRVLAQDINSGALKRLGERVERDRLDNVAIQPGNPDDPRLPEHSFDRIFMVHMYHEIGEPYAFLWRLRPALVNGGQIIVVDSDRPTGEHGIPPKLLFCEFEATGYRLTGFAERTDVGGYFARFEASGKRPDPAKIKICANVTRRSRG